jgi:hypothetical protein
MLVMIYLISRSGNFLTELASAQDIIPEREIIYSCRHITFFNFPFGKSIERSTPPLYAFTPLRKLWRPWRMQALGWF